VQDPYEEGSALRLHGPDEPVYTISVAARLLGVNPQTLRVLERYGLVCPFRTENNIRLYSENDLILLRRICHLIRVERINVAGVKLILRMEGILSDEMGGRSGGVYEEAGGRSGDEPAAASGREPPGAGRSVYGGAGGSAARRIPVEVRDEEDAEEGSHQEETIVDEEVRLYGEGRGNRPGDH